MIKREELGNKRSCLNTAHDDEPLFVLRANDALAPIVVREWASRYGVRKMQKQPFGMTPEQMQKQREAREIADEMVKWRRENRR